MPKIRLLNEALQAANEKTATENGREADQIITAMQRLRFPAAEVAIGQEIAAHTQQIQVATSRLRDYVYKIREHIKQQAAHDKNTDVAGIMLGQQQNGLAYKLLARVSNYSDTLRIINKEFKQLNLIPGQDAKSYSSSELAEFYFGESNLDLTLAGLSQIEAKILTQESSALRAESSRIGCVRNIIYDSFGAMAAAESNKVAAGTEYHAILFLAPALKTGLLQMTVDGKPLPVDKFGHGEVRFAVDPSKLGNRLQVTAYWTGTIRTSADTRTGDTILKVRVPYIITR